MQQIVEAVYENGIFRPLKSPELSEGQEVRLIIQSKNKISPDRMLQLASEVYQGFSTEQIQDIEQITLDRQNFFEESANQ
ncbi:MAG: antitoxin family protein [Cyanobacteria bacterium CRU_2_1]|nr:antitoxin family protein [Cyanobacteria bacterium RU_5_0]NJR59670.1 antitoxin family protein [Cyanobacteria bacterium CRU_2_1]